MRTTPPIPDWIKSYRHPAYTNIYELCPDETRVFGTESLYWDWDAQLLLLAKDYAPRQTIEKRIARGEARPFRHGTRELDSMGWRTNENLQEHLIPQLGAVPLLYGSAFGGLMRNDGKTSGPLPDETHVMREYAAPLLQWVVAQLTYLKGIACLGNNAWGTLETLLGYRLPAQNLGEQNLVMIESRRLAAFRLHHPRSAFTGGWEMRRAEWRRMAAELARPTKG